MKKWIVFATALALVSCGKGKNIHVASSLKTVLAITINIRSNTSLYLYGQAKADVPPMETLSPDTAGESSQYYKKVSPVTSHVTNGNGRIIHQ